MVIFMNRFVPFLLVLFFCVPAKASLNNDVANWLALRESSHSSDFKAYARFLSQHKDWPEASSFTLRAEQALLKDASLQQTLDWFRAHPPLTDEGRWRYLQALVQNNQGATTKAFLQEQWQQGAFTEAQQQQIMERFGSVLRAGDHQKRLSTLIWQGRFDRAADAMQYVNRDVRLGAIARIKLQRGERGALDAVNELSPEMRKDNGVLFDLARYYRLKDNDDKAIQTMSQRTDPVGAYAAQWWRERNLLARRALEDGQDQRAYNLVKAHGAIEGAELAEAEWLAGWIAVTRLKQPYVAYTHFERMYHNVQTPISVSRAAYWAGIAAQQAGKHEIANQWYRLAAMHMNTFYGQLAAYALKQPSALFAAYFKKSRHIDATANAALRSDLVGAARILNSMGKTHERDEFLRAALKVATAKNAPQAIIPVAKQLGSPSIALIAAKAANDKNILVSDALFPRVPVPASPRVETSLVLGIIRQESLFDPKATSQANARGLMQLLPGTAKQIARLDGLSHSNDASLYQPAHNVVLGQAYLGRLLQRYDGFIPLAIAAYNAGPGNVDKWITTMGDPRQDPYSWTDWVERIPFYETRNYVQRVWENYTAYKYLNGAR